jgi:TetR/AcrR family transcriptional regulator, transcriptional repressor for nem operon
LSDPHRRSRAHGCVLAALASDLARSDGDVKTACEEGLRRVHAEVRRHVPAGSETLAETIWGLLALELGGLLLSRMVATDEMAAEILTSCRGVVHSLLDGDRSQPRKSTSAAKRLAKRGGRRVGKASPPLPPK